MRGKSRAARSPSSRASRLDGTGIDSTRTEGPKEAATSAVSSVQPLATTITSKSCGCAGDTSCPSRRPITRASLCAGTTTLTTGGKYARTPALTWCQVIGAGGALRHALPPDAPDQALHSIFAGSCPKRQSRTSSQASNAYLDGCVRQHRAAAGEQLTKQGEQ